MKQIDSISLCICTLIAHRGCLNVEEHHLNYLLELMFLLKLMVKLIVK